MSGLASCCACFSLCSHTEWTGVCQSAASSSHSESPFSEPGALEEAEPDAGTETQTSDEGTHDPWPSRNRPHSHTRTPSWWWWWCWRVVATATAAMETLPPLSFPPFIHTPPSLPSLLPISPSELIEKTLFKALFWLVERWAEQSLRDCWLTSSGSPAVRCLALIFTSSSFLSLCLFGRGWSCGGGGEVRLRGPVGPRALLQEGSLPTALPARVTWLVGGPAQRQPRPGASSVHRGEGQASAQPEMVCTHQKHKVKKAAAQSENTRIHKIIKVHH